MRLAGILGNVVQSGACNIQGTQVEFKEVGGENSAKKKVQKEGCKKDLMRLAGILQGPTGVGDGVRE
jgi:hypothetical protein